MDDTGRWILVILAEPALLLRGRRRSFGTWTQDPRLALSRSYPVAERANAADEHGPRRVHSAFRIGDEAGSAPTGAPGVCQYGYPILELKKAEEAAKLSNGRATMKRILPVVPFLLVVLAGCANMTKQQQQMLSGGAMGAGTGATIGLIAGPPGALVGAVVGGAAGTVTGANWEGIKKATK